MPGHDVRVIERVHEGHPTLFLDAPAIRHVVAVGRDDLPTVALGRLDLRADRVTRHDDR